MNEKNTLLDEWIEGIYRDIGITEPCQLNPNEIASKLNVWLYYEPMTSQAFEWKGLPSMILDNRLSSQQQWQTFGHEMGHLLRHSGSQLDMSEGLIRFQESQANKFSLRFCVPSFMIINLNIDEHSICAVSEITRVFNVTPAFAEKRINQVRHKLYHYQMNMFHFIG